MGEGWEGDRSNPPMTVGHEPGNDTHRMVLETSGAEIGWVYVLPSSMAFPQPATRIIHECPRKIASKPGEGHEARGKTSLLVTP